MPKHPLRQPHRNRRPGRTRRAVLAFVRERIAAGAPPTVREVQQAFGFRAVQSAQQHLTALVAAGQLAHEAGQARGYRLPAGRSTAGSAGGSAGVGTIGPVQLVPRLGRVQAGRLQEAIEDPEGWLPVELPRGAPGLPGVSARDFSEGLAAGSADGPELFALTVRGESMTGAGILPGDTVVVRRQDTARDGEIVVALVQDEATVKRLRLGAGQVELHAEHPAFAPIVIAPDTEIRILGKVVEVRRRLA